MITSQGCGSENRGHTVGSRGALFPGSTRGAVFLGSSRWALFPGSTRGAVFLGSFRGTLSPGSARGPLFPGSTPGGGRVLTPRRRSHRGGPTPISAPKFNYFPKASPAHSVTSGVKTSTHEF